MLAYSVLGLLYLLLHAVLVGLLAWALIDAIMRPADGFALASRSKTFWVAVTLVGLLLGVDRYFFRVVFLVPGFVKTIAFWACLFGATYYLSSERRKMGDAGFRWPFRRGKGDAGGAGGANPQGSW